MSTSTSPTPERRGPDAVGASGGPLAQHAQSLPRTANEVQEALQQAAVEGIGQMNGALDTAIGKMLHLHGFSGQLLKDFINVGVQAAEGQLFGGAAGGSAGGGAGGFIGSIGKLLGGIFARSQGAAAGGASFTSTGDLISSGGRLPSAWAAWICSARSSISRTAVPA